MRTCESYHVDDLCLQLSERRPGGASVTDSDFETEPLVPPKDPIHNAPPECENAVRAGLHHEYEWLAA